MDRICDFCGKGYSRRSGGFSRHVKLCEERSLARDLADREEEMMIHEFKEAMEHQQELRDTHGIHGAVPIDAAATYNDYDNMEIDNAGDWENPALEGQDPIPDDDSEMPHAYVRIQHHPRTGRPDDITDLDSDTPEHVQAPLSSESRPSAIPPWSPFPSRLDFEFAEWATMADLSNLDINTLLSKLHSGAFSDGPCKLKLRNADQLHNCIDSVASLNHPFERIDFEEDYVMRDGSSRPMKYSVWVKNGLNWVTDLAKDPLLKDDWTWHACKKFLHIDPKKPDGERFIDDPLSADDAWEAEYHLENKQAQVFIILYSDKSNIGQFSETAIWPVVARIANLPANLSHRNSAYGGNDMIGLLPKIVAPEGEAGSSNWALFKRKIFHKAMGYILRSFEGPSKSGYHTKCGDGLLRSLVPRNPIVSQDLEEAFVSACCRGVQANFPCPRCLVSKDKQSDLHAISEERTQVGSQQIYHQAESLFRQGQKQLAEERLKGKGLYFVKNAWWNISRSDIHKALSYDVLHSIYLGLWGHHLWPLLQELLMPEDQAELNRRVRHCPSFPGLTRFEQLTDVDFADGKKHYSILQQILPLVVDLVHPKFIPFLHLIRLTADITAHARFKMQTITRLQEGHQLVAEFATTLNEVKQLFPAKKWDFPKIHQLLHLFDDIQRKGGCEYFSCHLGESFHQGLKKAYQISNKKNTAFQLLRAENRIIAFSQMRGEVDAEDRWLQQMQAEDAEGEVSTDTSEDPETNTKLQPLAPYILGSPTQPPAANPLLIEAKQGLFGVQKFAHVFKNFSSQLPIFLQQAMQRKLGEGAMPPTCVPTDTRIQCFKLIRHEFYSMDNGSSQKDPIRCNPQCYNQEHFDTVLVQTDNGLHPARLHLIFEITAYGCSWQLARVTFFTKIASSAASRAIGMAKMEEEASGEFILLGSIVRSCYLTPVSTDPHNCSYYLNDLAAGDLDLYQRLVNIV